MSDSVEANSAPRGDGEGLLLDPVVEEAQERFRYCESVMSQAQKRWMDDYKFDAADPDNGYQWPNDIRKERDIDLKPCLTINRTRQHNLLIINNLRRAAPSIAYKAAGGGSTKVSAQIYEDLARSIQYQSNSNDVYGTAIEHMVKAGLGYWLVTTEYGGTEGLEAFEQEIRLEGVPDPLGVFLDPDIQQPDGSDAFYGFVFKNIPRKQFKFLYPDYAEYAGRVALGNGDGWLDSEHVRLARYWRKVETHDEILRYVGPNGPVVVQRSKIGDELWESLLEEPGAKTRKIVDHKVEWFLIVGEEVVQHNKWPGKYVPIVRLPGSEHIIDGQIDMVGHTRALKDAQRMYNYWTSSAVEHVALQSKIPWIVAAEAIEGQETYWNTANTENYSYLAFNHKDEDGQQIPPPTRLPPPVMPQAYMQGMQVAQTEMMLASGQHEAEFGEQTPERSGVAISERQEQSDNATFHFMNSLARAIRFTGVIILDLAPHVYDVAKVMQVVAEDGAEYEVQMDPQAAKAYAERKLFLDKSIQKIFNPNVGRYQVEASVGPNYGTRRQAAQDALLKLMTQAPQLTPIIADLMVSASDWPMSDEAAERLRRMVPPQALGEAPPAIVQSMQKELQQLTQRVQQLLGENIKHKIEASNKQGEAAVDMYNAETQRIKVTGEQMGDDRSLMVTLHENLMQMAMQLQEQMSAAGGATPGAGGQGQGQGQGQGAGPQGQPGPQQAPTQPPQAPQATGSTALGPAVRVPLGQPSVPLSTLPQGGGPR